MYFLHFINKSEMNYQDSNSNNLLRYVFARIQFLSAIRIEGCIILSKKLQNKLSKINQKTVSRPLSQIYHWKAKLTRRRYGLRQRSSRKKTNIITQFKVHKDQMNWLLHVIDKAIILVKSCTKHVSKSFFSSDHAKTKRFIYLMGKTFN